MQDIKLNKTTYENHIDASVDFFMQLYASAALSSLECPADTDAVTSSAFDSNCKVLIRKECAKKRTNAWMKTIFKVLKCAAIVTVFLLALACFLFSTFEAVRVPIINYYLENSKSDALINFNKMPTGELDLSDPLAGLLPDTYHLVENDDSSLQNLFAYYVNTEEEYIFFTTTPTTSNTKLDSENAEVSRKVSIIGHEAVMVVKGNRISIVVYYAPAEIFISFTADNMEQTDAVRIVEQFIARCP